MSFFSQGVMKCVLPGGMVTSHVPPNQPQNSCVKLCSAFTFDTSYFEKQFFRCDGVCMTVRQKCQSLLQLRCLSGWTWQGKDASSVWICLSPPHRILSPSLFFLSYVPMCAVCSAFGVVTQPMRNLSPLQPGSRTWRPCTPAAPPSRCQCDSRCCSWVSLSLWNKPHTHNHTHTHKHTYIQRVDSRSVLFSVVFWNSNLFGNNSSGIKLNGLSIIAHHPQIGLKGEKNLNFMKIYFYCFMLIF